MSLEQLRHLKALLKNPMSGRAEAGKSLSKKDRAAMARKRDKMAVALHTELDILREIMEHETVGGKLNLGTKVEEVNWALMPESVARCFRPEFDYQPEEITEFSAEYSDRGVDGQRSIEIRGSRNGQWWSYVEVGSIVRRKAGLLSGLECMGSAFIDCYAPQAQPKAAREAMRELDESLWLDASGRRIEEKSQLPFIVNDINELRLGEDLLNFVMAEIQNRIQTTPTTEGSGR